MISQRLILSMFLLPTIVALVPRTNRLRNSCIISMSLSPNVNSNYPLSTRAALVQNAKELDEELAKGERYGSYSSIGWSNRLGTALTPVSIPGVYSADRPFYWNKIDVGGRMTVIQL